MNLHKETNENEYQFLWRLGQAKDSGELDLDWSDIANIMNAECRESETDYRAEAAYRKIYQAAKKFFESGVFNKYDDGSYIDELYEAAQTVRKEKQKLFDERTAIRKIARESARNENDLINLENMIKANGKTVFPTISYNKTISDKDLIVCLSDFHFGLDVSNNFGEYNAEVAEQRLLLYLEKILEIKEIYKAENAYVLLLGDILSGQIHLTVQLQNRENVTMQVQKSAELLSAFVYELSKHFNSVVIDSVPGNHSRTSFKDQVLRDNRLDDLIPWYMKAKLSHLDNVNFITEQNYDATIGCVEIRGKKYLTVHGDFDSFNESGLSKLLLLLDLKPSDVESIFFGHLHRCAYEDISSVKIIRSGSFCGSADDFSVSKRLSGKPSQMVCVVGSKGIEAMCPISLT